MEINRDHIIKALECCTRGRKSKDDYPCDSCPYNECNLVGGTGERQISGTCQGWLMKDALALIRELTEENERLRATRYMVDADGRLEMIPTVKSVRADTVRKMQEKLTLTFDRMHKTNFMTPEVRQWIIDQIAKEMLEETDEVHE